MADLELVEGWSGQLDFKLTTGGGQVFALEDGDLVTLILKTQEGRPIETGGNVTVVPPASDGVVRYSPDAGDLRAVDSPLLARIQITRGLKTVFFPNGAPLSWPIGVA